MGLCKYDEQTGSESDITILVYLQLVCGANPVCPVNIALVPVSSSHPSSLFSSVLGSKELPCVQGADQLCSCAREKHHLPMSLVLQLRQNTIVDSFQPPPLAHYSLLGKGERKELKSVVFFLSPCLKRRLSVESFLFFPKNKLYTKFVIRYKLE